MRQAIENSASDTPVRHQDDAKLRSTKRVAYARLCPPSGRRATKRGCGACELVASTSRILGTDQQIPFICLQCRTNRVRTDRQTAGALGRAQQALGAPLELLHDHPLDGLRLDLSHAPKRPG